MKNFEQYLEFLGQRGEFTLSGKKLAEDAGCNEFDAYSHLDDALAAGVLVVTKEHDPVNFVPTTYAFVPKPLRTPGQRIHLAAYNELLEQRQAEEAFLWEDIVDYAKENGGILDVSGKEISEGTGLPLPRVYEILHILVDAGKMELVKKSENYEPNKYSVKF